MRINITGDEKFQQFLRTRPDVAVKALAGALEVEAETIMTASKRIVPVDVGTLRGSGHVQPSETHGTKVSVEMGYGGAASAYALIQHERTDYHHSGDQQAKYLEQPVLEAAAGFEHRTASRIARRLEKR